MMPRQILRFRAVTACGLVMLLMAGASAAAVKEDTGFKPLFNGKDLTGWHGDPRLWKVENGEIVGSTEAHPLDHNSFLSTEVSYSDFILRVKVKLRNHNSGIQFRSAQFADYIVRGYQADVAEKKYFGMLYEEGKRGMLDYWNALSPKEQAAIHSTSKQGEWNEYEITCRGDRVKMVLNGKVTCDISDPEGAKEGVIALQLHQGNPMEVRFKDIYIKELAPGSKE